MKNPAPPNVSHMDVLRKMANLLANCFNMKVIPPENTQSFTEVCAAGQIFFKGEGQDKFPNNPAEMQPAVTAPVMIQVEFYPQDSMSEFRMSVRSTDAKRVAPSLYSLFKLFVNP